jgi:lipopolysaccharide transport system permease protein
VDLIGSTQLTAIYSYRSFIYSSVKREFDSRYRNSVLGPTWLVLHPLAQILMFTLVFSQLMRARLPDVENSFGYSIFLCAGLLTWGLFADILNRSQSMFLDNANFLKKLSFPRICLPIIVILNSCLGFAIILSLFVGFLLISGNFPGWVFIAIVPIILLQIFLAAGLGMLLGVLNVFFRDVGQLFGIVLQFWFWLTPIVYPFAVLPNWAQRIVILNPMTSIMISYQGIFLQCLQPIWADLLPTFFIACVLCFFSFRLFKRLAGEMVDEL